MQGTVKLPELAERLSGPTEHGRHWNADVINVQRSSGTAVAVEWSVVVTNAGCQSDLLNLSVRVVL